MFFYEIKIVLDVNCEHHSHDERLAEILFFFVLFFLDINIFFSNVRDDSPKGLFAQILKKWK